MEQQPFNMDRDVEKENEYRLASFVRSDEWGHVRGMLMEDISTIQKIETLKMELPHGTDAEWGQLARARQIAIDIVLSWMERVEGIEEQEKEEVEELPQLESYINIKM